MAGGKGIHIFIPKYFLLLLKIPSVVWSHGKRWNQTSSTIGGGGGVAYLSPFWEGTARK